MREILFLAHRLPFPPDRGDRIRSFHMLRHLAGLGRVHLAAFADSEAEAARLAELRETVPLGEAFVEVRKTGIAAAVARALAEGRPVSLTLFDSAAMREFVGKLLGGRRIDSIFVFSGQMAQFVPAGRPFVMDFVDMDSAKFEAYGQSGAMRWAHRREAQKLFAFERETAARAETSLFVSEAEAALFRARTGLGNVRAVSNGVDLTHFDPRAHFPRLTRGEGPLLLFTGQMDYRPNVEAVTNFARDVLPLLADVRFAVAGRNPARDVLALRQQGVTVTGEVDDMRSWLAAADVVVAPLGIARGIQNKVLEAMAMARPVVASSAAFEGIDAEPGRDLLVADGAESQAEAIRSLLVDPASAQAIAAAARRQVERAYRWDARLAPLEAILFPGSARQAA